jgi:hypothetical protein
MRFRPMEYRWGADYVLHRTLRKLKRRIINEHVFLLILRVLIALLLILAFARLAQRRQREEQIVHSGVHRVVVLDASCSMLAGNTGQTRWDAAMVALRKLMATWGRGESWSLYIMSDRPGWLVEYAVIGEGSDVVSQLQGLRPGEAPACLARALRDISGRFALQDVELFLLVDDQALTWQEMAAMPSNPAPRRTYWLNPPLASYVNTTVTRVNASASLCLRGHPTRVFVKVRHFATGAQDAKIEFLQDGEVVGKQTVFLQPGLEEEVHFDASFDSAGSHYVAARLTPDILCHDDMQTAGLEVEDPLNVLVLVDSGMKPYDSAWRMFGIIDLIQEVLEVKAAHLLFALHEGDCTKDGLAEADVVLIEGRRTVDEGLAALLADFVRSGGGLVLAAGVGTDRGQWNSVLGPAGLMPALLGPDPAWNYDPNSAEYKRLSCSEFGDGAFKAFATPEAGLLGEVQFFHWFDLICDEDQVDPRDILVRFDDHRPYLIRKKLEAGRVLLLSAGLNGLDCTLPVRECFVPFLYSLFREAAAGKVEPRALRTSEPIRYRVRGGEMPEALVLQFEGDAPVPLPIMKEAGGKMAAVYAAGIQRSGMGRITSIRGNTMRHTYFGVQGPRLDSDLRPLDSALKQKWLAQWRIIEVKDGPALVHAFLEGQTRREMYPFFLLVVLVLMLLELVYQRRFTRIAV